MFKKFSHLKIGLKIVIGILFVEFISLASGITMGRNLTSQWVIVGFIATIVVSQYIAWLVTENINKSVKDVLVNLTETSNNLNSLSGELTGTGHKLAEGTTQQAASIQETSSTLEESASMVHQTAQNTKEADLLAKQAKEAADKGNIEMNTMLTSMEELMKSSSEISKIIKVIDEIAFQTNILSLNAAVEAARAGDAGKGFAVVAEEVRNLAQRSAQAAKDTAGIIESNISLSQRCLDITGQVNGSLGAIKDETHKVSELLEEISTASQEQEIGIRQINQAVTQMETVIQANASTAQESAVSAEQLSTYADIMKEIVVALVGLIEGTDRKIKANLPLMSKPKFLSGEKKVEKSPKVEKTKKTEKIKKEPQVSMHSKSKPKDQAIPPHKERRTMKDQPKTNDLPGAKVVNPEDIIPLDDF